MACAGLSYVSAVVAGYLAAVSPLFHTGAAAIDSLAVAALFAAAASTLFVVDLVLARRRPARPRIAAI